MNGARQADWRRWAILLSLASTDTPMSTSQIHDTVVTLGWGVDVTLPQHGQWDAIHRSLLRLERGEMVERHKVNNLSVWTLTSVGSDFTIHNLVDNQNITPALASLARA